MTAKTIMVAFTNKYIPHRDTAYTYRTEDDFEIGEVCNVETPKGLKRAMVVSIDKEYNHAAEKRWGKLKNAFKQEKR